MGTPVPEQHKHVVVTQKAGIVKKKKKKGRKNMTPITQKYREEQFLKGSNASADRKYGQHQEDCKRINKGTKS